MDMILNNLLMLLNDYKDSEIECIKKAYFFAKDKHSGQFRQSGEPYITHPVNVACILADMHADAETICAGLLHDVLEDTNTTKEDLEVEFGSSVAILVDGVTKLSKMNFSSKQDLNLANTRKIITGITEDVRIIIIKLADRLHNMRTLSFKSTFKQKENALETMEIFVPLAYYIGAYRIKSELEDLAFQYLKPTQYAELLDQRNKIEFDSQLCLKEMLGTIQKLLSDHNIPHEIKVRTKNIYGIYQRLIEWHRLTDVHDLLALKVMVDEVATCYYTLGLVHQAYHPINDRFKDYICNPKTNMYRSLHTTVFGPDDRLIQTQIRTFEMDKVASFGLTAYWDLEKGRARDVMQEELRSKFQFFKSLLEINSMFGDNKAFVDQVKSELFSDRIYIYTTKGDVIELPKGSTVVDFAYRIHTEVGNTMIGALVNDKPVEINHVLHNKDRVKILTDELSTGPSESWLEYAKTSYAKRRIKENIKCADKAQKKKL